jgi:hypothetical protein
MAEKEKTNEIPSMSFKEFLENVPPYEHTKVEDLTRDELKPYIYAPEIKNYCPSEECGDIRYFDIKERYSNLSYEGPSIVGLYYRCRHCKNGHKWFSLLASAKQGTLTGKAFKLGEWPIFGDPIPPRVISLIGSEKELFLKGKRAEDQGLGIGAFTYYRRVVDNKWQSLLDEIIKVSKHLKRPDETIKILENAKEENQFDKAVNSVKGVIPESLLIDGHHNPLTLLYQVLSEHLHDRTDAECLENAKSIRLILFELSERINNTMKRRRELTDAISKFFKQKNNPNNNTTKKHMDSD